MVNELSTEKAEADGDPGPQDAPGSPSAAAPGHEPGRTPVAEAGARTAGGRRGELSGTAAGGGAEAASGAVAAPQDAPGAAGAPAAEDGPQDAPAGQAGAGAVTDAPAAGPAAGPEAESGPGGGSGSANGPKDAPPEAPGGASEASSEKASAKGAPVGTPSDAPVASPADAPEDAAPAEAPRAPSGAASPPGDEDTGVHRAEVRKSLLRPLISDLPAERPVGRTGSPAAGAAPGWAGAAASAPPAASAPLPPAAAPDQGEIVGPEGTRAMPVPSLSPSGSGSGTTGATPLKLLAQLTNTPPPRQTALRTVGRRFKIWTPLVILLAVVFVIVQAVRPLPAAGLRLTAAPSYAFPGASLPGSMPWPGEGQSVAEVEGLGSLGVHGAQNPVPIASLTKVMTAYVVLRDHPLTGKQNGPVIPVDQQAADESASADESTAHVSAGQKFTERQLLQLLLVPSGNNIARLLARWDAGTQQAFVTKMTSAAAGLGMTHTTYTGASGFEETTVSTAVDQLKLAREVMKNEVFRSVVALPNVDVPGVGRIYNNNNDLVKPGVVGIKTGSSTPAGGALMWAAKKKVGGKDQLILGVVLQQHGGTTVNDSLQTALTRSQQLIEAVQGGLTSVTVVKKGDVVGEVRDGLGGTTPVAAAADLTAVGWPGLRSTITLSTPATGVPHSAKAGAVVGTLTIGAGSARTTVPAVLKSDLAEPSFGAKLTHF